MPGAEVIFKATNQGGQKKNTPPTANGTRKFKYYYVLLESAADLYPQQYESCTKTYNHFNILLPPMMPQSPKWSLHFAFSN